MQKGRDVYVIGAANVGKSTLVNRMVAFAHGTTPEKALGGAASALTRPSMATQESDESLEEAEEESTLLSSPFATAVAFDSSRNARRSKALVTSLPPFVTSSPLPGTTVTVVSVPFIGATALHDTPGVVVNQQKQDLMESLAKQGGSDCVRRALLLKQKHVRLTLFHTLLWLLLIHVTHRPRRIDCHQAGACFWVDWHGWIMTTPINLTASSSLGLDSLIFTRQAQLVRHSRTQQLMLFCRVYSTKSVMRKQDWHCHESA